MIDKDEQLEENIRFLAKCCNAEYNDIRLDAVLLSSLEMIKRQQAEIEKLKQENKMLNTTVMNQCAYNKQNIYFAHIEAIKAFAKKVKFRITYFVYNYCNVIKNGYYSTAIDHIVEGLVKEMTGDATEDDIITMYERMSKI